MAISNTDSNIERVVLPRVTYASRTFSPRRRVLLDHYVQDGVHYYENRNLGICVFGRDQSELDRELAERLAVLWDEYACETDHKLAAAALRLKKTLLDVIEVTGDAPAAAQD